MTDKLSCANELPDSSHVTSDCHEASPSDAVVDAPKQAKKHIQDGRPVSDETAADIDRLRAMEIYEIPLTYITITRMLRTQSLTTAEICRQGQLARQTVQKHLIRLIGMGWAKWRRHGKNRRSFMYTATAEGVEAVKQFQEYGEPPIKA